jgi:hypothetical protein
MIKIKDQLPSIYYDASRDFQILGHLYEVILNYAKTNADMLYMLPNGIEADTRSTELLATTLGFRLRRNYDKDQLAALVSIFPKLLKIKGTKAAVDLAGNALVKASGVPGAFTSVLENNILTVRIPIELTDITLFMDLLPYILPFGIRVSVIRATSIPREIPLQIASSTALRKVFADVIDSELNLRPHPLGLANISDDNGQLSVDYSNSYFVKPEDDIAVAGMFGTSPIINFSPRPDSPEVTTANEEDT